MNITVYVRIQIRKNCHQHTYKFQSGEHHFRDYPIYVSFQIFSSKSCLFFLRIQQCFENSSIFSKISNFQIYSRQVTFLFLGLIHFLRGWGHKVRVLVGGFIVAQCERRANALRTQNVYQKCPSKFFILFFFEFSRF